MQSFVNDIESSKAFHKEYKKPLVLKDSASLENYSTAFTFLEAALQH